MGGYNEQHHKTMASTECDTFGCTSTTAIKLSGSNGEHFFKFARDSLISVNLISTCTTMSNSDTRNASIAAAHRQQADTNNTADAATAQHTTHVPSPPPALDPCAQPWSKRRVLLST
ncbi:unnamed protein product [Sphagnum balticum]